MNPERAQVNVTIKLNDDAHGVVEFAQDSYTVIEKDQSTVANISIIRKRGTFGDVRVFYRYERSALLSLSFRVCLSVYLSTRMFSIFLVLCKAHLSPQPFRTKITSRFPTLMLRYLTDLVSLQSAS